MEYATCMWEQSSDIMTNDYITEGLIAVDNKHFVCEESIISRDTEAEKCEFDGLDCSWYWDNDFDCLSVTDDGTVDTIPVAVGCGEDMMKEESVVDGNEDAASNTVPCCILSPAEVGNFDLQSNEDYLKNFEEKFLQTKDFRYNFSSVSSSLSSSSSDSCWREALELEESSYPTRSAVHSCVPQKSTTTTLMPLNSASLRMHSYFAKKSEVSSATVCADSFWPRFGSPFIRNEVLPLKTKKKRRKTHQKISLTRASTLRETDRRQLSISRNTDPIQGLHRYPVNSDPGYFPCFVVIAVSGLSVVVGVFCGLLIGGQFSDSHERSLVNLMNERRLNCRRCLAAENDERTILNSVWAQKYEELVVENSELLLKLGHLHSQLALDFYVARDSVVGMLKEFVKLSNVISDLEKTSTAGRVKGTTDQVFPLGHVHFLPLSPPCTKSVQPVNQSGECFRSIEDLYK